jgi:hypothetical protein
MPRSLSSAVLAAIAASAVSPAMFVSIAFANETLYMFTGIGTITPPGPASNPLATFPYGETWQGLGWLFKISQIPQTSKIQAQNITLQLSGIPSQLMVEASQQVRMNGVATVWFGFFDSNGNLIEDPVQVFLGGLDVPTLSDDGNTCTIAVTCENPLLTLNLAPNRQFDDADQQIYFSGDLGLSFVDALVELQLLWPTDGGSNAAFYPTKLTLTPNNADIVVGGTEQLTATVYYSDGSSASYDAGTSGYATFHCASSNPAIATVDSATGIVTGVSPGVCNIILRSADLHANASYAVFRSSCNVIVRTV